MLIIYGEKNKVTNTKFGNCKIINQVHPKILIEPKSQIIIF